MEKTEQSNLTKSLFMNYLRDFYIELTPDELAWVQAKFKEITNRSWCAVIPDIRKTKGLISYYLISLKCPEYRFINTVDLVQERFNDEETTIRNLIAFQGIVIIRHMTSCIKNKLMMETLMYILNEREYKNRVAVVVSELAKDQGEYTYYDHNEVQKYLTCSILDTEHSVSLMKSNLRPNSKSDAKYKPNVQSSYVPKISSASSRPLANLNAENKLKNRAKMIEENSECNTD